MTKTFIITSLLVRKNGKVRISMSEKETVANETKRNKSANVLAAMKKDKYYRNSNGQVSLVYIYKALGIQKRLIIGQLFKVKPKDQDQLTIIIIDTLLKLGFNKWIVIPAFNRPDYLQKIVDPLLQQLYPFTTE